MPRPRTEGDGPPVLALDVDGTLLDSDKRLTPAAAHAVAAVRRAGVRVVLATGRIPAGIAALCGQIGLDGPQVCMHGAVVAYPLTGEVVSRRPLNPDDVRAQLSFARRLDLQAIVADLGGFRVTELRPGIERFFLPYDEPLPEVLPEAELAAGSPLKTYLATGAERYQEVLAAAASRFGDRFTITSPDHHSVELLAPGVSKLAGLRVAAAAMGLELGAFAAVGDGPNDVPLLEAATVAVAMGQAPAQVQAAATFVTDTNDRDGLAKALARIYRNAIETSAQSSGLAPV